ncbi:MAG: gluconokinase [Bacteroidota bacterium]
MQKNKLIVVMGVSGAGKSTIGRLLAQHLALPFFDADDFHSKENKAKMAAGTPLNDDDRYSWLIRLNEMLVEHQKSGVVLACSALKNSYRKQMQQGVAQDLEIVFLTGTFKLLQERLQQRKNHYMPASLLQSQLATLEIPEDAITIDITDSPEQILQKIIHQL